MALYDLLIDSDVRLIEAVKALEQINSAEQIKDFYRILLGLFRESKSAFFVYLSKETYQQITNLSNSKLDRHHATDYYRRICKVTAPKYLRKFTFDKMLELGLPESVADFYQGRVPRTVGARHHANLIRLADKAYPKFERYLTKLGTATKFRARIGENS